MISESLSTVVIITKRKCRQVQAMEIKKTSQELSVNLQQISDSAVTGFVCILYPSTRGLKLQFTFAYIYVII